MNRLHPFVIFLYFLLSLFVTISDYNIVGVMVSLINSLIILSLYKGWKELVIICCKTLPLLIITVIVNLLTNSQGETVLFFVGKRVFTLEALIYGLVMAFMIFSILFWCFSLNHLLTSDKIMGLIGKGFPILGLLLSLSFKLIPDTVSHYKELVSFQRQFNTSETGIKRFKDVCNCISMTITWVLETGIERSDSMRARGYGKAFRTSYFPFRMKIRDYLSVIYLLSIFILVLSFHFRIKCQYIPHFYLEFGSNECIYIVALFGLFLYPCFVEIVNRRRN